MEEKRKLWPRTRQTPRRIVRANRDLRDGQPLDRTSECIQIPRLRRSMNSTLRQILRPRLYCQDKGDSASRNKFRTTRVVVPCAQFLPPPRESLSRQT